MHSSGKQPLVGLKRIRICRCRAERAQFQDSRKRKIEELEAKHDEQKGNMAQDLAKDSELRQQFNDGRKHWMQHMHSERADDRGPAGGPRAFDSAQTSPCRNSNKTLKKDRIPDS